jgi:iron complex outermembrane recepter protein
MPPDYAIVQPGNRAPPPESANSFYATDSAPTAGGSQFQNLTGQRLAFAPLWVGSLNVSYEIPVTDTYSLALTENTRLSSGYITVPDNLPDSYQTDWVTFDASMRFGRLNGPWEVALIGRNLTNRLYVVTGFDAGDVKPGVMADANGIANRSRQIVLQFTVRPNMF